MNRNTLRSVLARIRKGDVSRGEAAEELDVSLRTINRLMLKYDVRRPPSPVHRAREAAAARRGAKLAVMAQCAAGEIDIPAAAEQAGLSQRTVFRWLARLKSEENQRKSPKIGRKPRKTSVKG